MATIVYRNITIFFKNGEKVEIKKVPNEKWGMPANGVYFYVEGKEKVTHDGKDYFEQVASGTYYPVVDIDHITSEIYTKIDDRREIFEHKKK